MAMQVILLCSSTLAHLGHCSGGQDEEIWEEKEDRRSAVRRATALHNIVLYTHTMPALCVRRRQNPFGLTREICLYGLARQKSPLSHV